MGPSFPHHQPVIYGPQGTPMQAPQTYFHPNGPQYGQQMLLGQPRQVVYMPTYPPVRKSTLTYSFLFYFCTLNNIKERDIF